MHTTAPDPGPTLFNEETPAAAAEKGLNPVKAPLLGMVVGIALAAGVLGWTALRLNQSHHTRQGVEDKRAQDARRVTAQAKRPSEVRVVSGTPETLHPSLDFEGTLAPTQSAELGFKTGGHLIALGARLGDSVRAGSILARLDASQALAQVRVAEAQVRAAEAQLSLAEDAARRTAAVVSSGSAAEASGVQAARQGDLASAQLDAARAQLLLAQAHLQDHTLSAPFAGTLVRTPVGVGGVVGPGVSLFELADLSTLKLKGSVAEQDANLVQVGSEVEIETERGPAKGIVITVLGALDATTRRVPIEVRVANRGELRAGSLVRAQIRGSAPISVLRLPHEALRPGSQDEVFAVESGRLASRHVVFSVDPNGALLVRSGLQAKDQIVLSPKPEARARDLVTAQADPLPATPGASR